MCSVRPVISNEAIETGQRAVRLAPEHPLALAMLGHAYTAKGWYNKAIQLLKKAEKLSGGHMVFKTFLGRAYGMSGQREKALNIFNEVLRLPEKKNFPSVYIAGIYVSLGEQKKTLEHLEIAFTEREMDILSIKEYYWWDPLRDDPHFQDLLRRINFPD